MPNLDLLKKGFLFQNLTPDELEFFTDNLHEVWIAKDKFVFREGTTADSMFVIQAGTVEILKDTDSGNQALVSELKAGDHFGEMSFIDRGPRAASALARESLKLLEVKYEDLERLIATKPGSGLKLYHALATRLCQRIRQTTEDFSHLLLH